MPITRVSVERSREINQPDALKAAFAEFFSMLIFLFAGQGSGMAFSKILNSTIVFILSFYILQIVKF